MIPVAVIMTLVLSSLLILALYLFKKKRCHVDFGLQGLICMQFGTEGSNVEESILITELEDEGNR